ncbi:MAG: cation-translocating P-type ATPase [Chloroflexota bacterium]|nr:MAG: cation-translocating P-type ATPase [Chloroflexota bacterium]
METRASVAIEGMDCPDCARSIERAVSELRGVRFATVNFAAGELLVEFDAQATDRAAIDGRIRELGYEPHGAEATAPTRPTGWISALLATARGRATLIAATVLAIGFTLDTYVDGGVGGALMLGAVAIGGYHSARSGFQALRLTRSLDMNALMTIAVIGAVLIGDWPEAASVVVLFALGNTLEAATLQRARAALTGLIAIAPTEARVRRNGDELTLPVGDVRIGDTVRVRPGERIPLDGQVTDGNAAVDHSPMTGESVPIDRSVGDEVLAGTIVVSGYIEARVTSLAGETALARVIRLVERSQSERSPSQRLVDRFAALYTPVVIALAAAIAIVPPIVLGQPFESWVYRALVLLVIACPCALVISTPVAIMAGISSLARAGVLVKSGAHLEALGDVRVLALDKTGTLTRGRPEIVEILAAAGQDLPPLDLLGIAAGVEARSEHPIGRAIVQRGAHDLAPPYSARDVSLVPGLGARGTVTIRGQDRAVTIGAPRWLRDGSVGETTSMRDRRDDGLTVIIVGIDGALAGEMLIADPPRPEAADAILAARDTGIRRVTIVSGDHRGAAGRIARLVGVDETRSDLLPDEKVAVVRSLRVAGDRVAMVGDGINDGPALAAADVGIAMGRGGSGIATEAAGVILMRDDLRGVAHALRVGQLTRAIIAENIAFALVAKILFLTLGALGLANLWVAVAADMGTSLVVTLNSLRAGSPREAVPTAEGERPPSRAGIA